MKEILEFALSCSPEQVVTVPGDFEPMRIVEGTEKNTLFGVGTYALGIKTVHVLCKGKHSEVKDGMKYIGSVMGGSGYEFHHYFLYDQPHRKDLKPM